MRYYETLFKTTIAIRRVASNRGQSWTNNPWLLGRIKKRYPLMMNLKSFTPHGRNNKVNDSRKKKKKQLSDKTHLHNLFR